MGCDWIGVFFIRGAGSSSIENPNDGDARMMVGCEANHLDLMRDSSGISYYDHIQHKTVLCRGGGILTRA